jgi:hypothetical protein
VLVDADIRHRQHDGAVSGAEADMTHQPFVEHGMDQGSLMAAALALAP